MIILYTALVAVIILLTAASLILTVAFVGTKTTWEEVKIEKDERWLKPVFLISRAWTILTIASVFVWISYQIAKSIFGG